MELTYAGYLKLDRLLDLQEPKSDPEQHDELLFIVIHQVYELWFKQVLHELDRINVQFSADDLWGAVSTFKRVRMIFKTLVNQLDILETMTPLSFTAFRDRLERASGFQSSQFRELEFLLGYKRPAMLKYLDPGWHGYEGVVRRLEEPSVIHHFYGFLAGHGVEIPHELRADPRQPSAPDERVQRGLLELYRTRPDIAVLFELMTDVDEGMQEWRYRHVKLAERTIGNKHGTGGSPGVEFLKRSLFHPIFPDLWAIRHMM